MKRKESTGGGARTPTPLREMDFESIASTNSATPAIAYSIMYNNLVILFTIAGVAELVDAVDSKSISFKRVGVRAPPPVQIIFDISKVTTLFFS